MTSPIDDPAPKITALKPLVSDKTTAKSPRKLNGLSDIRRFFYRNTEPVYFISATPFNLLGIDEWVGNFTFINAIDCFEGNHPNIFVPPEIPHEPFTSIEDINNYLLSHPEVIDFINARGPGGKAVFLMFDETTEALCKKIGLEVCFPTAALRNKIDDKVETTRIADRAGVPSVPNVLMPVKTYKDLEKAHKTLGTDLVIQTAYGDSGHTTFFVASEADFNKHAEEIAEAPEVKVMKRIRCRGSALEACVTSKGTIVGPLMTELVGFNEMTPYRGGWCGNEVFADSFNPRTRKKAREYAVAFGDELKNQGYRGYFELDFLVDLDTKDLYLGECNPRITGASSMTNLACFAHADAPLFLFHLLEWMGVDYNFSVNALNRRWASPRNIDSWSQLVIKHTGTDVDLITDAPPSGIYEIIENQSGEIGNEADGTSPGVRFVRTQTHRRTVGFENRAFFLQISGKGDYRYEGADLGILVSPGRFMDKNFNLTERAKTWVHGIKAHYQGTPLSKNELKNAAVEPGDFKLL